MRLFLLLLDTVAFLAALVGIYIAVVILAHL